MKTMTAYDGFGNKYICDGIYVSYALLTEISRKAKTAYKSAIFPQGRFFARICAGCRYAARNKKRDPGGRGRINAISA